MEHATFPLDIKSLSEAGLIQGLAAGYGNVDAHGEIFAPGAFAKAIASAKTGGRQPAMLLHHDPRRPAGRWDAFTETKAGLDVSGQLALDSADGREAYALLKGGALTGLSVGFRTISEKGGSGPTIITEAELFEVSLVATPSNPKTRISSVKGIGGIRDLEEILRERFAFSSRKAKAAAAAAWRAAENTATPTEEETRALRLLSNANLALRIL